MEFQTELKKELNQTRLKISLSGLYTEDYQIRMLRENRVQGMLPISARGEGETTVYEYDITGMISLRQYYKQKKISGKEMNGFLKQIQEAVEETSESEQASVGSGLYFLRRWNLPVLLFSTGKRGYTHVLSPADG